MGGRNTYNSSHVLRNIPVSITTSLRFAELGMGSMHELLAGEIVIVFSCWHEENVQVARKYFAWWVSAVDRDRHIVEGTVLRATSFPQ